MYYDIQNFSAGRIIAVIKGDEGLRYIGFQQGKHPLSISENWKKNSKMLKNTFDQLHAYFAGKLFQFDLPVAPLGTSFQKSVWNALMDIPYGHTVSYGDIAAAIGKPKACRAVGGANGKNPIPIVIPCHRVIGADGRLTGYGSGLKIKAELLSLEKRYKDNRVQV